MIKRASQDSRATAFLSEPNAQLLLSELTHGIRAGRPQGGSLSEGHAGRPVDEC